MNAEKYLEQVGLLTSRITYHREHIMMLMHEKDGIFSRWGAVSGGGGNGDAPYARMIENIERKKEELAKEEELLQRLRAQVEEVVGALPDEEMQQVLLYRYMQGKNYIQIADLMFTSRYTVMRRKEQAIELLEVPEDAIDISSESCTLCNSLQHNAHFTTGESSVTV